jgi:hypothetical protein
VLGFGGVAVSTAVNVNVTVPPGPDAWPLSVSVAGHPEAVGAPTLTVSRGSDGAPAEQDATPVPSLSTAGSVTVVVLLTFRSIVAVAFDVAGPKSVLVTFAAAGGVICWVVPGWAMNPPLASTNGVAGLLGGGGSNGVVAGGVPPVWTGPGLPTASQPVNRQFVAPTPGLPPKGTTMPPPAVLRVVLAIEVTPMFAGGPPSPLVVVNTLPVLNAVSAKVRLLPRPICAPVADAVGAMLMVALSPSRLTAVIVLCGLMPPPVGPATKNPMSAGVKVPGAAVSVGVGATQDTPGICRPGAGWAANAWLYVNDPVALPSVEPTVSLPTLAANPPVRAKFTCW